MARDADAFQRSGKVRPEAFLFPPWRGAGVVYNAFGLPRDEYEIYGQGRRDTDGEPIIDFTVAYGNGMVSVHEFRIKADTGDRIIGQDLRTGSSVRGRLTSHGFVWGAQVRTITPFGLQRTTVESAFTLLNPHEAKSEITISFLGVTVGTAKSQIRHLDPQ